MTSKSPDLRGRRLLQVIGTSAALLVVAGTVGIPFDILAAAIVGASVVALLIPRK